MHVKSALTDRSLLENRMRRSRSFQQASFKPQPRVPQAAGGRSDGPLSIVHTMVDEAAAPGTGLASVNPVQINLVKVFSATKAKDRESLGEVVTSWIARNPGVRVLKTFVMQSSDSQFHCLSIVLIGTSRAA